MVNIGVGFELSASTIDIGGARLGSQLPSLSRGVASICFILPSHLSPSWITSEKPPFPLYQSHSLAGLIYYNIPDLWAQWWVRGWGRRVSRPSRMRWDFCMGRFGLLFSSIEGCTCEVRRSYSIWIPRRASRQTRLRGNRAEEDPSGIMGSWNQVVPKARYIHLWIFLLMTIASFLQFSQPKVRES